MWKGKMIKNILKRREERDTYLLMSTNMSQVGVALFTSI